MRLASLPMFIERIRLFPYSGSRCARTIVRLLFGRRSSHLEEKKIYLLSYPRSGNSWVRYIAEYISGRKTLGSQGNPKDVPLYSNKLDDNPLSHVDGQLPPILFKTHGELIDFLPSNDLVLITRSPSIAIRRVKRKFSLLELVRYVLILNIYHQWEGRKHLVKYEDLMAEPDICIHEIARFLEVNSGRIDDLLRNYDYHKEKSIILYSGEVGLTGIAPKGLSLTRGKLEVAKFMERDYKIIKLFLFITRQSHLEKYFYF